MRWKFLFIKYRADVHWWGLVVLFKGVLLNIGFLFLVTGVAQIYWVMAVVVMYTIVASAFRPWRHMLVNLTDVWSHIVLIMICSIMTWFARNGLEPDMIQLLDEDMMVMLIFCSLFSLVGIVPALLQFARTKLRGELVGFWNPVPKQIMIQQFYATVTRVANADKEKYADLMKNLTEWDLWFVRGCEQILLTEVFGNKSRSGLSTLSAGSGIQDNHVPGSEVAKEVKWFEESV